MEFKVFGKVVRCCFWSTLGHTAPDARHHQRMEARFISQFLYVLAFMEHGVLESPCFRLLIRIYYASNPFWKLVWSILGIVFWALASTFLTQVTQGKITPFPVAFCIWKWTGNCISRLTFSLKTQNYLVDVCTQLHSGILGFSEASKESKNVQKDCQMFQLNQSLCSSWLRMHSLVTGEKVSFAKGWLAELEL